MRPDTGTSDEILALRASRGDDEAFSVLVRRYGKPLYSFLRRYHPDRDDCDDLFQDTWMRVLANLHRFQQERRFSTWLFQIALNQCRDLARRGRVRSEYRAGQIIREQEKQAPRVEEQAEARRVLRAVEEMPERYKEVLLLRYYNGFSEAETAEILGCPQGTVKSRLHHAVRTIREKLGPNQGTDV